MELITQLFDTLLHLDELFYSIIGAYGLWTYALLFLIIFLETGALLAPFLPGDSLLFVAGSFSATGVLNVWVLFVLLSTAATVGDSVNYWIGRALGPGLFERDNRFLKKEYLKRTQLFFAQHGGKAIFFARLIPMFRGVAPLVAAVAGMSFGRFLFYNTSGRLLWNLLFIFGGYFFGTFSFVQQHFQLIIPAIVTLSLLPLLINYFLNVIRQRRSNRRTVKMYSQT